MLRKSVVAGQFYPAREEQIKKIIASFCPESPAKVSAKGIILPHAGYIYSGEVAAVTVSKVSSRKRLVMLGPNHTGSGENFSLWAKGAWAIPSGQIVIDEELAEKILGSGNCISADFLAHIEEHSLEVELPILRYFFGEFSFVPIACMQADLAKYREVASQLYNAVKNINEDVFFVASTDLTHYEPDATVRKKDRDIIEAIIDLDEEELVRKVRAKNITMCGEAPVAIFIACLKKLGAHKAQVALYQTSGDKSGDYSSVVGYVGMIVK
jgi:AmmeMemoRadiSam system protein B